MSTRWIFIRHCESIANKYNVPSDFNTPITKKGIKQSMDLREYLSNNWPNIDKVFYSPMMRAKQTAKILGYEHSGVPCDDIVERANGSLSAAFPNAYRRLAACKTPEEYAKLHNTLLRAVGGECDDALTNRCCKFIKRLRKLSGNIIIITHGDFIESVLNELIGIKRINIANCSLTVYLPNEHEFELINYTQ